MKPTTPLLATKQLLLNRYRVVSYVAEGGMQQVFEAVDTSFNRTVALKVPKIASAEKRFARSAQMSARINHNNIAKTLDYFEEGENYFLVEEFIPGIDLEKALKETFLYFDPHLAARFVHNFAKGLAAAHHANVFHRDLKPSNLMVSNSPWLESLKITDFGVARMAQQEIDEAIDGGNSSITGSQTAFGTLPYMAPELIEGNKNASLPADIWAVGAILFRLLAGETPFGTGLKAIPKIVEAKLPEKPILLLKGQFVEIGTELWEIMSLCLKKDAASRPTADQLVDLSAALCYSIAPRFIGTVYNVNVGLSKVCFLEDCNHEDFMFHKNSFYGSAPKSGMKVMTSSFPGSPKPRAFPVLPLRDDSE